MTDWQTYRNVNLREIWNLERLARNRAAKLGYRLHRSRRRKGRDNAGEFMLIHEANSIVLLGDGYTAKLEVILEFMDGSGFNDHQQQGARKRVTSDEAPRISAQIDNALPRRLSGKRIPSERADVNA